MVFGFVGIEWEWILIEESGCGYVGILERKFFWMCVKIVLVGWELVKVVDSLRWVVER